MLKFPLLCLIAALLPATVSALEPVRVVATGGRMGSTFFYPPDGKTEFRQRTPHKLGGSVEEMQIGFMDWMYPSSGAETPNALNDVTIQYAWLERASTGQVVPLTFSGSRSLVLPMNSVTPYWLSDPIPSSAWTGTKPARDEVIWLHVKGSIPADGKVPTGTPTSFSGSKFLAYLASNDPGTFDTTGPIPTITGSTANLSGLPLIFLGRFTGPGHLSVIGIGDSIMDGSGDAANPVPVISGYGFFNRAALDASGANAIATFNLTRHGQAASSWVTATRQKRQAPFLKFANVVAEEYGTNDLGGDGSGNPTTLLTNTAKIWTAARDAGVQKIVRTLLMPRTTDPTFTWKDTSVQTPNNGWGAGGKRDIFNDGLIAARDAGKIDVLVDTLAVMADPADSHIWRTTSASKYTTSDGTHISPSGNALLAPHLRAAFLSLTIDQNRPDYAAWSSKVQWNEADSSPKADPNNDGTNNLLAYAQNLPPLSTIPSRSLPFSTLDATTAGGPWLTFVYRENASAMDFQLTVEASDDMVAWTTLTPDGTNILLETADADVDKNGSTILRRLCVKQEPSESRRFLRMKVRY